MKGLDALLAAQDSIKLTANHRYYVDGRPVPGCTTLIKKLDAPQLDNWRVKVQSEGTARAAFHNPPRENEPVEDYVIRMRAMAETLFEADRIAKEAADEGTEVHSLIDWRMRTALGEKLPRPVVSEAAAFREAGWVDWAKSVDLRPIASEFRLYNPRLRYCGTGDLLAWINGKVSLADWKRSRGDVYESHILQSIGYRMALEEYGFDPMPGYVLLMPPGGDIRLAECRDDQETRDAFRACVHLYSWTNSLKRSK